LVTEGRVWAVMVEVPEPAVKGARAQRTLTPAAAQLGRGDLMLPR